MKITEQPQRWALVDARTIKMTEGEGVVAVSAADGLVWVAVKKGPDYIGNAFKPAAARDLARSILGEADEADRLARLA